MILSFVTESMEATSSSKDR